MLSHNEQPCLKNKLYTYSYANHSNPLQSITSTQCVRLSYAGDHVQKPFLQTTILSVYSTCTKEISCHMHL
jgi:hypothetical protein